MKQQTRSRIATGLDQAKLLRPAERVREGWLSMQARGGPAIGSDGLALPPARLRLLVDGRSGEAERFQWVGSRCAELVRAAVTESGTTIEGLEAILDFGCGCGRVARNWASLENTEVHGCDYNPELVGWCNGNLPFLRATVNRLEPPLPYVSGSFDLVYAMSVLSHLSEPLQRAWIAEFQRILRPGGMLLVSVLGDACADRLNEEQRRRFDRGEMVVERTGMAGSNLCTVYHPRAYVREELLSDFANVRVVEDESPEPALLQDPYIARRPLRGPRLRPRRSACGARPTEAGDEQRVLVRGADHRLPVEFLDRELRQAAGGDGPGEGAHRLLQLGALELQEAEDAAPAALDVEDRLAVAEQDVGAGGPRGPAAALALGPGQRGAVWVGRVGRRQQLEAALVFGQRAQPLDRAGQRELGAAEALDEVAAAGGAEQLEVAELRVEGREAAGDALGEDRLAGDDPVALEHQLGLGAQPRAGLGAFSKSGATSDQRPCTAAPPAAAAAGEAASSPFLGGHRAQARGAQRREGVVGHLARPGQVPERVVELLDRLSSSSASRSSQKSGPAASRSRIASWTLALGPLELGVRRRRAGEADVLAEVEGDAAVVAAAGAGADPDHLAAGAELVEPGSASRRRAGAAGRRASQTFGVSATPCSGTSASRRRSGPAPAARWASTFCQLGRKRAKRSRGAASTSRRRWARLARRTRRRTSESHHSRSLPPGSSSPRTRTPARSSSRRAGVGSIP